MHLLFTALLATGAFASDPEKPATPTLDYVCVWSTKTVTHVQSTTLATAKEACAKAPPAKGATLLEVRAPDKNGKHGDILIDGVPIDYD